VFSFFAVQVFFSMQNLFFLAGLPGARLQQTAQALHVEILDLLGEMSAPPGAMLPLLSPAETTALLTKAAASLATQLEDGKKGLLFYHSPWGFLAGQVTAAGHDCAQPVPDAACVDRLMSFWRQYQAMLLQVFQQNRTRSLLLAMDHGGDADLLAALLRDRLGLGDAARHLAESITSVPVVNGDDALAFHHLIDILAPESAELYLELESAADLLGRAPDFSWPGSVGQSEYALAFLAQSAERACLDRAFGPQRQADRTLGGHVTALFAERERAEQQAAVARQSIASLEKENAALRSERHHLAGQVEETAGRLRAAEEKQDETGQEAELLLLQLHQVQEELESTFLALQQIEGLVADQTGLGGTLAEKIAQVLNDREQQAKQATDAQATVDQLTKARDRQSRLVDELQAKIDALSKERDQQALAAAADQTHRAALEQEIKKHQAERHGLAAALAAAENKLHAEAQSHKEAREEAELLLLQLHQVQEELEHYFLLNQKQDQEIADLKACPPPVSFRLFKKPSPPQAGDQPALTPKPGLVQKIANFLQVLQKHRAVKAQMRTIRSSGLFDEEWYLRTYPDVEREGMDPVEHYVRHGFQEGRDPSPHFQTAWYLYHYPDVRREKVNPLIHYIHDGKREGRQTMGFIG
jgi:hypothetical protein